MRPLVAILVLVVGCGGGGDGGDGGGDPVDAGLDGDACGAVTCSEVSCGTTTDDCGEPVVCDRCRFSSDTVATEVYGGMVPVALMLGDPVRVGYDTMVATRGSGWSPETLPGRDVVDLALVNGTMWALLDTSGDLSVAFSSGGPWTVEPLLDSREGGRMAVAPDGTVFVAYGGGGNNSGVVSGLVLAQRSAAGTWTYRTVSPANSFFPEYVDLALVGGEPWIAWHDNNLGALALSTSSGGSFTTEIVDADVPVHVDHQLSLAVDAAGRPHIAYRQNSALRRHIDYAVRDGGTWTVETAVVMRHGARGDVRVAVSPAGTVAIAYLDSQGLGLATRDDGRWFTQPLVFDDQATVDLAYDDAGTLHAALRADDEVHLFTRAGTYPADYDATCAQLAATLCPLACACNDGCCIGNDSGLESCASPLDFCEYVIAWQACGDASQDPQLTDACAAAASTASCPTSPILQVPAACTQF